MPKLFLHIGTHKTGTTSIQRFCAANRDALREHGLWYPPADVGKFPSHYAHHRISHAIADRDPDFGVSDAKQFFRRVRRKMKSGESCLISAEPMYRHMLPDPYRDGGPQALDPDESDRRFSAYAEAVRDCLDRWDVTVVVMLRRQDEFLESLFAEHVLATLYRRTIDRFAQEREPLLDYNARLGSWTDAFGDENISVRTFERSNDMPIERTFLEWLDVPWNDDFDLGRRHNVTPPRSLVEYKRLLNAPGQRGSVNRQLRAWLEQLAKQGCDELPDIGKAYLSAQARVDTMQRYAEGNRSLARRYLGRESLFDEPPPATAGDPAPPDLGSADVATITRLMVTMLAERLEG